MKSAADFRWEYGKRIPRAVIGRFARQIAEQFRPDKIILFGSYAYGKPHKDSDVDILVVMPAYDEINQAVRIRRKTDHPFPLDLIVRTPAELRWRLEEGDWFMREVVSKGKVLYEKADGCLDSKSRKRSPGSESLATLRPPFHDETCFHCQQAAEKFFKALLQEWGLHLPENPRTRQTSRFVVGPRCHTWQLGLPSGLAHSIRTSFIAIQGFTRTAQNEGGDQDGDGAFAASIVRSRLGLRTKS